jgi:ankyrin repeat protein
MPLTPKQATVLHRTLAFKIVVAAPLVIVGLLYLQPGAQGWIAPRSRRLLEAVRANDLMLTATLLESGADPDARSAEGVSALGLALRSDAPAMAKLLIDRGANVNLPVQDDISPLALAIDRDQPQIVGLLLDAGAGTTLAAEDCELLVARARSDAVRAVLLKR